MNAWLPQASYPCGNFSDTSSFKFRRTKGSIGHAFAVCILTENQNQMSFYPFVLHEISVLIELILGHLRYLLTDVPPQPNSPPDNVFNLDRGSRGLGEVGPPVKGSRRGATTGRGARTTPRIPRHPAPTVARRYGGKETGKESRTSLRRPGPDNDRRPRRGPLPGVRFPLKSRKKGPGRTGGRREGRLPAPRVPLKPRFYPIK